MQSNQRAERLRAAGGSGLYGQQIRMGLPMVAAPLLLRRRCCQLHSRSFNIVAGAEAPPLEEACERSALEHPAGKPGRAAALSGGGGLLLCRGLAASACNQVLGALPVSHMPHPARPPTRRALPLPPRRPEAPGAL